MLPRKVTETKLKYKLNTNGVCVHTTKEYSLSRILPSSIFWYNQTCQAGRVNKLFTDWFTRQFVMRFAAWDENVQLVRKMRLKVLAHGVRNFICVVFFFVCFLFVILSYQNVCYKWENSENRTISDFFFLCQAKVLKVVCKRDWHNVRSYLFLMSEKFWLRVQWP